ncbi:TPA: DNA gyrase subunit A, partial [bacterium]|nr:DNA gyrase subunit A [bacterium]
MENKEIEELEENLEELKEIPGVKKINLSSEVKSSFLDYAMSVIVSRALPDVRDGLKPVHRRIIHSMNELGVQSDKAYKKSARIVGDTMGKYHPHGDTAIYEALVRLAQDFSSRYPLVDGHGNFGSIDGDGAAAMRYTEARMAKIAMEMVKDINKETVDFIDNYDGSEKEPAVLPSRFPNLLVNGTMGIAVGMATNIPPHNLGEVIDAVLAISENPDIEVIDLINEYILGPDFPTGGIILGKAGIKKAYETGNGSILVRAKCHFEDYANNRKRIVVTEIPYQVNKSTLLRRIVDLVKSKTIDGISDIRDESNRHGMRVIIELKREAVGEVVLNQLYKLTQLQTTFGANMLAIVEGEPKVLGIKEILNYYLLHQQDVLTRRTKFDLDKANNRIHILQGLQIAIESIDEVLAIIRGSETTEAAIESLKESFDLSDRQAKAILDMRLQRLTGLEKIKIINEIEELENLIKNLTEILENKDKLLEIIREELIEMKRKYGDERRTEISNDYTDIEDEDLIPEEEIVITLTVNNYIKRLAIDTYRTQNRGGRGVKGMATNNDDVVDRMLVTSTHTDVLFFTNKGKVYRLRGHQIPEFSRQSKGIPVINLLDIEKGEEVKAMISLDDYNEEQQLLFVTKKGISKRVSLSNFENIRKTGKIAVSLKDDDELFAVRKTQGNEDIFIAASNGKLVRFNE